MSGLGIRLYTDEDVDVRLAEQLRRRGYDVISCRDAGRHRKGIPDDDHLVFATRARRAILVHNSRDYVRCDHAWKATGQQHWGILVIENGTPIGELVRRIQRPIDTVTAQEQYDTLLFVSH